MISSVRSINDTKHIALYNYDNSFCFHISDLQRLHCSPTLNKSLSQLKLNENVINKSDITEILLLPLKIYSELDDSNELMIYSRIKDYFNWFVPNFVSPSARHGYDPTRLMIYFLLPVVYKYFPDKFKTIIEEIHVDKINFNNIDYVAEDVILKDENTFIQAENDRKKMVELYKNMIENLPPKYERKSFVASVLEVYPNKDRTGGHAITLIKGISDLDMKRGIDKVDFYIIDDQNSISKLYDYYNNRKERLYEISIRDVDEITMVNVNAIFHAKCDIDPSCKFSKRVSRFVLNFEQNFLSVVENVLKPELENVNKMRSDDEYKNSNTSSLMNNNCFVMFILGLIIGLIIGLIVHSIKSNEHFITKIMKHKSV